MFKTNINLLKFYNEGIFPPNFPYDNIQGSDTSQPVQDPR